MPSPIFRLHQRCWFIKIFSLFKLLSWVPSFILPNKKCLLILSNFPLLGKHKRAIFRNSNGGGGERRTWFSAGTEWEKFHAPIEENPPDINHLCAMLKEPELCCRTRLRVGQKRRRGNAGLFLTVAWLWRNKRYFRGFTRARWLKFRPFSIDHDKMIVTFYCNL